MAKLSRTWEEMWERVEDLEPGGQGFTYKVRRKGGDDQRLYVLKRLRRQEDPKLRRRMNVEVASLQQIDHPNVAKVIESNAGRWEASEDLYLVMEYVPGPHLAAAVEERGSVDAAQAVATVLKLLDALRPCHRAGVVHRDIKPENIVLRDGNWGDPVLLDFNSSLDEGDLTELSESMGNRFLRLPDLEADSAWKRDPRIDITQCVGILFFLFTGHEPRLPVDADGRPPHKRLHAQERLSTLDGTTRAQLERVFQVGLSHNIEERWTSITVLVAELNAALATKADGPVDFHREVGALVARFSEGPIEVRKKAVADLLELFGSQASDLQRQLEKSLAPSFQQVSSGWGHNDDTASAGLHFRGKLSPRVEFDVRMELSIDGREAVLFGRLKPDADRVELLRFGVFDSDARKRLRPAMDRYAIDALRVHLTPTS